MYLLVGVIVDPEESSVWFDEESLPSPDPENSRSMTVAVVGAPNAGKSTLMNALVDSKVVLVIFWIIREQ